ncbi:hypothetical protein J6590_072924 [Homalodisca vitripennis]|nr:hypothetical protein J6590_072924 [Homalodisca vitripennis]
MKLNSTFTLNKPFPPELRHGVPLLRSLRTTKKEASTHKQREEKLMFPVVVLLALFTLSLILDGIAMENWNDVTNIEKEDNRTENNYRGRQLFLFSLEDYLE